MEKFRKIFLKKFLKEIFQRNFSIILAVFLILRYNNINASVAQWIEQWPPEPCAEVRFLSDAFFVISGIILIDARYFINTWHSL